MSSLKKPPQVQQAVIAKRLQGEPKRKIARDLGIHRRTVDRILTESQVEAALEQARQEYLRLVPGALEISRRYIEQGKEAAVVSPEAFDAAQKVLKGTGVHEERTRMKGDFKVANEYAGLSDDELRVRIAERLTGTRPKQSN